MRPNEYLERQCWVNEQYSTCECLEISHVSESITDKDQEGKIANFFQKIDIKVHPGITEACQ